MNDPLNLYRKAEEVLRGRKHKPAATHTESEILRMVHELEVHQIELEMVNEELLNQNRENEKRVAELTIANKQIADQRDRLIEINNLIPGAVIQFQFFPDGRSCFSYVSQAFSELCRLSPEEVRRDSSAFFKNIHPEDIVNFEAAIQKSAKELSQFKLIFRMKFDDGAIFTYFGNGLPQQQEDGTVTWNAIITDITNQKKIEESLLKSEESFRNVVEHSPIPNIVHRNSTIIYANPALLRMLSIEKSEDLIGTSIIDWIHPDFHEIVKLRARKGIEEGLSTPMEEIQFVRFDKTAGDAEAQSTPITYGGLPAVHISLNDITERKQAEVALRAVNKTLSDVLNAATNTSIISTDTNGLITLFSKGAENMLGYSADEIVGKETPIRFHSESEVMERGMELTQEFGRPITGFEVFSANAQIHENDERIWTYIHKNGTRIIVNLIITAIRNTDEELIGLLGVASNITKRKEAEEAFLKSSKKWDAVISASPDGIGIVSLEGKFEFVSNKFVEMLGYSIENKEDFFEKTAFDFVDPSHQELMAFSLQALLEGDKLNVSTEYLAVKKDNSRCYFDVNFTVLPDTNGKPINILFISRDINERKKAENELNRVSTRLTLATRAGGVGIWDYDLINDNLLWDDQMYQLYHVNKDEFSGAFHAWSTTIHPDDILTCSEEIQMAIRGEKEFDTEFRVVWPDGSVHTIRGLATVYHDNSVNPIRMIGMNWDITEQKKNIDNLKKATIDAEAANKSKSIFLANMSHEIRTPLNAVIGFSQLMSREQLTDSQKDYVLSIHSSGEHLLTLINDILELSKMEAGRVVLNPTNVDLNALLGDMERMFTTLAQAKQLQLEFETTAWVTQYILVDDSKLRQIFINLIGNAIKFTDHGGVAVRARIDWKEDSKSLLVVEIQDSGTGISESELEKLFRHFEQAGAGIKQRSGTGLGLALSRELAILMGGDITVTSEINVGSVFRFQVEINPGNGEIYTQNIAREVLCIDNPKNTYRILVVDDIKENRQLLLEFLRLPGFETREAVNGEEAITLFEQWNPHLILMDLRMPVMDGYEAIRRIKETLKGESTPIIVLSAGDFEEDKSNLFAPEIHGFIRKPFRENELFESIGRILCINYIYKENLPVPEIKTYLNTIELAATELLKLPPKLISQMKDALEGGDFYLLIDLIREIEPGNPQLAEHLRLYANNFDYDYLNRIINEPDYRILR